MRVEVGVDTTGLASLDKLNSLHNLMREGDLVEADFACQVSYSELVLWAGVGVHQDDCEAVEALLLVQVYKVFFYLFAV